MPMRQLLVGAAFGLGCAVASASDSDFGLFPLPEDLASETESLAMSDRLDEFDRILEELERVGAGQDSLRRRLVALYAGSPLMKHRVLALEFARPAQNETPDAWRELDRAYASQRTFDPWGARRQFERVIRQFPQWAPGFRNLGVFLFERGAHLLEDETMSAAQRAFESAVRCPDAAFEDWLGIAACMVARRQRADLPAIVEELRRREPRARSTLLYGAIVDWDLGFTRSAASQLREVVDELDPATARIFVEIEEFLHGLQPLRLDPSPLQPAVPRGVLEWQLRIVEAEILFGDRGRGLHGWESAPGQAWLIYGHPIRHRYFPPYTWGPSNEVDADEILSLMPGLEKWRAHIFEAVEHVRSANGLWLWIVQFGELELPYLFQKNAAFAKWDHNPVAHQKFMEPMRHALPINLSARGRPGRVAMLESRHASFRALGGAARVECAIALQARSDEVSEEWTLRWRLSDGDGRVLSELQRPIAELTRRGDLESLPRTLAPATRLTQFAAVVGPGRLLSQIALLDASGRVKLGEEALLDLPEESVRFGMSELLLADSFRRQDRSPRNGEFVRHAIEVVPHPEHAAHAGDSDLYVYYEIYDAQLDEFGSAHLDLLYQIFDANSFDPLDVGREGSTPVGLRFTDERTGRSPGGAMVRGTALPLERLEPGEYVLAVSVFDRLQRMEAHRTLRFAR